MHSETLDRNLLIAEAGSLASNKHLTAVESQRFETIMSLIEHDATEKVINKLRLAMVQDGSDIPRIPFDDREGSEAFCTYVRKGVLRNSIRGAQTTGSPGGGALIPQLFFKQLMAILKQYDRLFDKDVVTVVETKSGAPFRYPLLDDVDEAAVIIPENIISNRGPDLVFGELMLPQAPTWRSGWITLPIPLIQDSGIPVEDMLIKALGIRIARGVGANLVATLLASALVGATARGAGLNENQGDGTNSIGTDDLYSLMGSVNPAYLTGPKVGWAMNFSTLITLLKIKDMQGRPIIHPHYDDKGNFLLLEKPVFLSPSFSNIGTSGSPLAGNIPIAFGDFSRFIFREVENTAMLLRATEMAGTAENFCISFQSYLRCNAGLMLDPAGSPLDTPIKLLQNATS